MTKNAYLIIGLVFVLVVAALVFVKQRGGGEVLAPTGEELTVGEGAGQATGTTGTGESAPSPQSPSPTPPANQVPATYTVTYTSSGFSPKGLTIKAGDTVVFKNNSSADFWPASAIHPTHEIYPEFDAKRSVPAGSSYSFIFTRTGSWKYHNHLNPSANGTITVQ